VDTQFDYFDLAIQFSQNGPGLSDDTADFFVNGQLVGDDITRDRLLPGGRSVFWGAVSSAGICDVHFERVAFYSNIPETDEPEVITGTKFDDADGDDRRGSDESGLPGWTIYLDQNSNGQLDVDLPGTKVFQDGVDGYANTVDATVADDGSAGDDVIVSVGGGELIQHGLLRFDNIIGTAVHQVPPGARIANATLSLFVTDEMTSGTAKLHRLLQPWNEANTWANWGDGVSADGIEAAFGPDATLNDPIAFGGLDIDVTTSLQAWADGAENHGWVFLPAPGSDAWNFRSAQEPVVGLRPRIEVEYVASEPSTVTDESGHYEFTGLTPGTYRVAEVAQPEWQQTYPGGDGTHLVEVRPGVTSIADFGNRNRPPVVEEVTVHTTAIDYSIPTGAEQFDALPWSTIRRVGIRFSEEVDVGLHDFAFSGLKEIAHQVTQFAYDPGTFTATWTLGLPLFTDQFAVRIRDSVVDLAGTALDGEWDDGDSTVSGDGEPGGDFVFHFNVFVGDATRDGRCNADDIRAVRENLGSRFDDPGYTIFRDLNGDRALSAGDMTPLRRGLSAGAFDPTVNLRSVLLSYTALSPQRHPARQRTAPTIDLLGELSNDGDDMRGTVRWLRRQTQLHQDESRRA